MRVQSTYVNTTPIKIKIILGATRHLFDTCTINLTSGGCDTLALAVYHYELLSSYVKSSHPAPGMMF